MALPSLLVRTILSPVEIQAGRHLIVSGRSDGIEDILQRVGGGDGYLRAIHAEGAGGYRSREAGGANGDRTGIAPRRAPG